MATAKSHHYAHLCGGTYPRGSSACRALRDLPGGGSACVYGDVYGDHHRMSVCTWNSHGGGGGVRSAIVPSLLFIYLPARPPARRPGRPPAVFARSGDGAALLWRQGGRRCRGCHAVAVRAGGHRRADVPRRQRGGCSTRAAPRRVHDRCLRVRLTRIVPPPSPPPSRAADNFIFVTSICAWP